MRECWALCWSGTYLSGEEGLQADIMQKYARHQNAYATTVSVSVALILPPGALTFNTGKQPGMHPPLSEVALCCQIIQPYLMPVTGHESNGCPHPRTTDGKLVSTQRLPRMVTLTLAKVSNATIAKASGTSKQTARLYESAAPVREVDAAILVANRVI